MNKIMKTNKKQVYISCLAVVVAFLLSICTNAQGAQTVVILDDPRPVKMTWTDNSTSETSFNVERNLNGGQFKVLAAGALAADVVDFTDSTVEQSQTVDNVYCYRVFAANATGNSLPSNEDCATIKKFVVPVPPVPAAPSGFTTSSIGRSTLESVWQVGDARATGTELQRINPLNGDTEELVRLSASTVFYRDSKLLRYTSKCYAARHLIDMAASKWSLSSCARTR